MNPVARPLERQADHNIHPQTHDIPRHVARAADHTA